MAEDSDYSGFLSEELNERLKAIQEGLEPLKGMQDDIRDIKERMDKFDDWKDLQKSILKDLSKQSIITKRASPSSKLPNLVYWGHEPRQFLDGRARGGTGVGQEVCQLGLAYRRPTD